eukprot:4020413-Amphidinium_carterae.1
MALHYIPVDANSKPTSSRLALPAKSITIRLFLSDASEVWVEARAKYNFRTASFAELPIVLHRNNDHTLAFELVELWPG